MRIGKYAGVAGIISLALAASGCSEREEGAASVSPATTAASSKNTTTDEPAQIASMDGPTRSAEYQSRDGQVFYYLMEDGSLIGARDLGRLPADQDFSRVLKKGDRAVQFDGALFAAVSPGSQVVRIARNLPGEQILRPVENVPLGGGSPAAKALRDSLAGRLTFPSEATLDAQATAGEEPALAPDDGVSNARPDDYEP